MDFVTPDFGKAPRDDTTFDRKRMGHNLCTEAQSFVYFGQLPLCTVSHLLHTLATIYYWPK